MNEMESSEAWLWARCLSYWKLKEYVVAPMIDIMIHKCEFHIFHKNNLNWMMFLPNSQRMSASLCAAMNTTSSVYNVIAMLSSAFVYLIQPFCCCCCCYFFINQQSLLLRGLRLKSIFKFLSKHVKVIWIENHSDSGYGFIAHQSLLDG